MTPRNRLIGLVDHVWEHAHVYNGRLASGLCAKLAGYDLVAANDVDLLPLKHLSGILYHYRSRIDIEPIQSLKAQGIPLVLLNSPIEGIPSVNTDFQSGLIEAVFHLKKLGRRKIAYVRGRSGVSTVMEQYEAYLTAMDLAGTPHDPALEVEADFGYEISREAVLRVLETHKDIDAIICCSDLAAMGAVHAAKMKGMLVPEDVAIIGLGNLPEILAYSDLPLTTIADPLFTEAYQATEKLINCIEGTDTGPEIELVSTHLVKRYSTLGEKYRDPQFTSNLKYGRRSIDHLLCIGGSLDKDDRISLLESISPSSDPETKQDLFTQFCSMMLEAISLGYDASLAHDFIIQLGNALKAWSTEEDQIPSNEEMFDEAIYRISCKEITQHGRFSRATQEQLEQILEPLANFHDDTISMASFLKTLVSIREALNCEFVGFMLLDKSVEDLHNIKASTGKYWTVSEQGVAPFKRTKVGELSPRKMFRRSNERSVSLDLTQLFVDGETAAIIFLDMNNKFSPFYRKIKPILESKLHRTRLFASLENSRKEIQKQKTLAEAASKAKSDFLAVISHEIRTPLNCFMGMTELTLHTDLNGEQRKFLELAYQASKEQLELINDLLNLSKIESGGLEIKHEPFALSDIFDRLKNMMTKRASDKGLQLSTSIADNLPPKYIGDPYCIHQILTNLVGNSIKFTQKGSITVSVELSWRQEDSGIFRFRVKDTGIGIPENKLKTIFNAFEQVDSSKSRSNDGVGLGLAIVKKTADSINGTLHVESEEGVGTCFTLDVPIAIDTESAWESNQSPEPKIEAGQPSSLGSRQKILVVDDNESNVIVSRMMLERSNFKVDTAQTGRDAIELWRKNRYTAILLDLAMPEMNGHDVAFHIRRVEQEQGNLDRTPIIALTASAEEGVFKACKRSGMDEILTKPVSKSDLMQAIEFATLV